ncbi:ATP-binding protein [Gimibacter soli]|uniref:DUF87 domain-containing protein n=1 Tax=Gimibacter soli TaxID=3024400 RepID=A0AAF0BMM3_9PROT|nr:DUF87 domain-containing protein [Gimibacter soli]WCL54706.1 DUF87 domain-containing protein [Gimibacter soli]
MPDFANHVIGAVRTVGSASVTVRLSEDALATPGLASRYRIGGTLKLPVEGSLIFGTVRSVAATSEKGVDLTVDFLGERTEGSFSRGVRHFPMPGTEVLTTDDDDLAAVYAPTSDRTVRIGTVFPSDTLSAGINAEAMLSRHFAILGSTGTGKSTTTALIIHRLVEANPNAHIVILDPHNEYERAFQTNGVHVTTENLSIPYWLMNFEEHVELLIGRNTEGREAEIDILKRCLLDARKKSSATVGASRLTVDTPIPYKLTDLLARLDEELGRLDKAENVRPFLRLKLKIEELRTDQRYAFMFSGLLMQDNLASLVAKLMRFPVDGRPVSTLDLSGVPSDIVDVVVSLLSRLVFDFSMWSRSQRQARPVLLVCEEAHRYVPNAETETRIQSARKSLERIAKEGRKYGVSLGLVSQRPSDLSEAVLSQCGTILSMRMNNDRDRAFVTASMPEGSESFLASLPTLQNRECIIAGEGAPCPMRVRLDFLEEELRPASDDPRFTESWRQDIDCLDELVNDTIRNWRRGVR